MKLRFGQKISAGICALVVGLLAAVLGVSNVSITRAIEQRLSNDLEAADKTVAEVLRLRSQELSVQTRMLADVPQLRAVIDTPGLDHATVLDNAQMDRKLIGSDLLMLVDDTGHLLASATEPERFGESVAANPAVAAALSGATYEGMLVADNRIYQIVASPIAFNKDVAGALVTGFAVGDELLGTLERMTNSFVALWSGGVSEVSADARPVFGMIAPRLVATAGAVTTIRTESGRYLLRVGQIGNTNVSYALMRSLDAELAFYSGLRTSLLVTGVCILTAALLAGLLFSRRVTRPIEALAAGTARLAEGDLSSRVAATSTDEVGQLALAFNRMADDIEALVEEERGLAARTSTLNTQLEKVNAELKFEITERHEAELEVKRLNEELEERVVSRTADLEAANRQLEAFSYSVSHDLRGPLRRLTGFSMMLLEDAAPRLTDEDRGRLERIKSAAVGMNRMVENLLEFSHVGRSRLDCERVDLSAMVRTIADELTAAEPGRRVEFSIAPDLVASGDEALLRVVLQNLLSNAWKFTGHSPRARIEFGAEPGGNGYFVRDNGAGFDMADAHKLFRVFERLHSAYEYEGHGIGLATVQRIVEHHGGRIWAESAPEGGATFHFTLASG